MLILIFFVINYPETLSKRVMLEKEYTMAKVILDEISRVTCIPRKYYNAMCEKIGLIKN